MTAEIVILNKHGVAIAADSAVTVRLIKENEVKQKIYNSSNKLFSLSKYHPVGIMIYGQTDLLNTPFEILIKQYRKQLRKKHFANLVEYASDFIDFIQGSFSDQQQKYFFRENISSFFHQLILSPINKSIHDILSTSEIDNEIVKKIAIDRINDCYLKYGNIEKLPHLPDDYEDSLLTTYENEINLVIKEIFEELPIPEDSLIQLKNIATYVFSRDIFPDSITGIVITGYGEQEIYPSIYSFIVDGMASSILKYKIIENYQISDFNTSAIIPFAQTEIARNFLEGIDPEYNYLINSLFEEIITKYPLTLIEKISNLKGPDKEELTNSLIEVSKEVVTDLQQKLIQYKKEKFINPIVELVSTLPKEDLAEMAESLVNLTSFKRRVTFDAETVGGPIDVAVISKGDGFIWIKRKHYFDSSLNHHFIKNYFKNFDGEKS